MQNTSRDLEFRDFKSSDYPQVVELFNSLYPNEPIGLEQLKNLDKNRYAKRVLIYKNNNLSAYYQYRPNDSSKENGLAIAIVCNNAISNDDLQNIYTHLQDTVKLSKPEHLITRIHEPETTLHNFYLSNGFVEEERMWPSTLYLKTYDLTALEGSIEKAKANGIQFKTLADFPDNETTQTMYYNCVAQCLQDVPTVEEINVWPFERWKERFWDSKDRLAETNFMAFDDDELVGVSQLFPSAKTGNIRTGLTGVLKNYRGKGIAKALKQLATNYAISKGYQSISTHNHSINKPMLAINEAMGYVKSPAVIFLKKKL